MTYNNVLMTWSNQDDRLKYRGKSGLRRAGCRITSGGGDPKESATENIPLYAGRRDPS